MVAFSFKVFMVDFLSAFSAPDEAALHWWTGITGGFTSRKVPERALSKYGRPGTTLTSVATPLIWVALTLVWPERWPRPAASPSGAAR